MALINWAARDLLQKGHVSYNQISSYSATSIGHMALPSRSDLNFGTLLYNPHSITLLPKLLPIILRKPLIRPIDLLPANEAAIQDVDRLLLDLQGLISSTIAITTTSQLRLLGLPLAQVLQGGAGPPLLAQRAVEHDRVLVCELPQERRHHDVEAAAGEVQR